MDGTHYRLCGIAPDESDLYLCADRHGKVFWVQDITNLMSETVWYYYISEAGPKLRVFGGTLKPQKDVLVTHKHCFDRTDVWELSPVSRKTKDVYLMKSTYYNRYVSTKPNRPLDGKGVYQAALAPWLTFMSVEKCIRLCPVPGIKPPPRTPLPPTPPVLKTHDLMVSV